MAFYFGFSTLVPQLTLKGRTWGGEAQGAATRILKKLHHQPPPRLPAGPSFSPHNVRFLLSPDPYCYVGCRPQGRKKVCHKVRGFLACSPCLIPPGRGSGLSRDAGPNPRCGAGTLPPVGLHPTAQTHADPSASRRVRGSGCSRGPGYPHPQPTPFGGDEQAP